MLDIDKITEFRRQCFVDCITKSNIVGIFGDVKEDMIRAYGFLPVPLEGIDAHIFEYGDYDACDVIKSTIIYLTTQKCPILFSCKAYILDNFCSSMIESMKKNTNKSIHVINESENLEKFLEQLGGEFSNDRYTVVQSQLLEIEELIDNLCISNLSGIQLFVVEFFSKYILDLDERIVFLKSVLPSTKIEKMQRKKVKSPCPLGIYKNIDEALKEKYYRIIRSYKDVDFTCEDCIIKSKFHKNY